MREAGRIAGAIEVLDAVMNRHQPVKDALRDWGKAHRFAGSGDRAWMSGLVLDALRRRSFLRHVMGEDTPRALVLGALSYAWGMDAAAISATFEGDEHAPDPLTEAEIEGLSKGAPDDTPLHILADVPEWLGPSFERAYGEDAALEGQAMAGRAPVDLRVNRLKAEPEKAFGAVSSKIKGIEVSDLTLDGLRIPETDPRAKAPGAESIPAFGKGWVEVQDAGSQIAAAAANAQPGEQVLDYCAGGGGKTLAMASQMQGKGQIFAYDIDGRRLSALIPRLKRSGAHNVQLVHPSEPTQLSDLTGQMDCVFVDAPCTGTGTWRRRPDAKWRLKERQLEKRMGEQDEILAAASHYVKPGGRLVYATCSFLIEEDEDRVANFLSSHADFSEEDAAEAAIASGLLTEDGAAMIRRFRAPTGSVRLTPRRAGTDGFFFAVLRKAG